MAVEYQDNTPRIIPRVMRDHQRELNNAKRAICHHCPEAEAFFDKLGWKNTASGIDISHPFAQFKWEIPDGDIHKVIVCDFWEHLYSRDVYRNYCRGEC